MDGLIIHITWPYFLGIIGSLIALAWYAGSRLSAIENDAEWLKGAVATLSERFDALTQEIRGTSGTKSTQG